MLCDKTQNISVDSVLVELIGGHRITFFIGEDVFELKIINENKSKLLIQKKLKDFSETLKAPINISFFRDKNETSLRLLNVTNL